MGGEEAVDGRLLEGFKGVIAAMGCRCRVFGDEPEVILGRRPEVRNVCGDFSWPRIWFSVADRRRTRNSAATVVSTILAIFEVAVDDVATAERVNVSRERRGRIRDIGRGFRDDER